MSVKAIFAIGNKGAEYQNTRHNLGWMILDDFVKSLGGSFKKKSKYFIAKHLVECDSGYFVKFNTFVNIIGPPLACFVKDNQLSLQNILVVCDDMDLSLGRMKIRPQGGHGGHNGLRSIISALGCSDFPRLRVGIGSPESDCVEHVLGRFSSEEKLQLPDIVTRSVEAVKDFFLLSWEPLMSKYNLRKN